MKTDMLARAILGAAADKEDAAREPMPLHQQYSLLDSFLESSTKADAAVKVGDCVELTAHGLKKYRFPRKGYVGIVTRVFERLLLDDNGQVASGEIAFVDRDGDISPISVDLRFYQRVERDA